MNRDQFRLKIEGLPLSCNLLLHSQLGRRCESLGKELHWGWKSHMSPLVPSVRGASYESHSSGLECKSGGKSHPKLNISLRPIAKKYREGKVKRTLRRELKVCETAGREANGTCILGKIAFFSVSTFRLQRKRGWGCWLLGWRCILLGCSEMHRFQWKLSSLAPCSYGNEEVLSWNWWWCFFG